MLSSGVYFREWQLSVVLFTAIFLLSACSHSSNVSTGRSDLYFEAVYKPIMFDKESCEHYFGDDEKIPNYVVEKQGYFNIKFNMDGFDYLRINKENLWAEIVEELLDSVSVSEVRTIVVTADVSVGASKILVLPIFTMQQLNDNEVQFTPVARITEFGSWATLNISSPVVLNYTVRYSREVNSNIVQTVETVASSVVAVAGGVVAGPAGATISAGLNLLSEKAGEWDSSLEAVLSKQKVWQAGQAIRLVGTEPESNCQKYQRGAELKMRGHALNKDITAELVLEYKASQFVPPLTSLTSNGYPDFSGLSSLPFSTQVINLPPKQKPKDFYSSKGFYISFLQSTAGQAEIFGGLCKGLVDALVESAYLSRYDAIGVLHGELLEHAHFRNSQQLIDSGCLQRYGPEMTKLNLAAFESLPPSEITRKQQTDLRNASMDKIAEAMKADLGDRLSGLGAVMSDKVTIFDESGLTGRQGGAGLNPFEAAMVFVNVKAEHFGCYWWPGAVGDEVIASRSAFFSVPDSNQTYFLTATFEVTRNSDEPNPVGKLTGLTIREGNKVLARRTLEESYGKIGNGETADKYKECVFFDQRDIFEDFDLTF